MPDQMIEIPKDIKGLQEVQAAMNKQIAALKPTSNFGKAVKRVTIALQRYAISITHVWPFKGGALRASHRMYLAESGLEGKIYIDPGAMNPRGQRPSIYGPFEEARGGEHAFYRRTVEERGQEEAAKATKEAGVVTIA